jgi:hypothetical protein
VTERNESGAAMVVRRIATGPRSPAGKTRSRPNARRHGLATSVYSDPECSAGVEKVAREIAGPVASEAVMRLARTAAEAQLDVIRCRQARCRTVETTPTEEWNLFEAALQESSLRRCILRRVWRQPDESQSAGPVFPVLSEDAIERYRQRTLTRRKRSYANELIAIDRYEHRALLRRNRALQDMDCQRLIEAVTSRSA